MLGESGSDSGQERRGGRSAQSKLAFAYHPLVPVHFVFDPVPGAVSLAEEQTHDFVTALGVMLDASLRVEFHGLADSVFMF